MYYEVTRLIYLTLYNSRLVYIGNYSIYLSIS
jgi:hypothetical protein